jgi:UDPglucose--hexose-1-phosphate uridylyltransferase
LEGVGCHEVIIETPAHEVNVGVLSEGQFEEVLRAYRSRIVDLKKDKRLCYVLVFKNQGLEAGATLEHSHSQLVALPVIPQAVVEELVGATGSKEAASTAASSGRRSMGRAEW